MIELKIENLGQQPRLVIQLNWKAVQFLTKCIEKMHKFTKQPAQLLPNTLHGPLSKLLLGMTRIKF